MPALSWVAVRPEDLVWREWDEYGAIYDVAEGSTHVLSVFALEILALASKRPISLTDLVAEFAEALPPELSGEGMSWHLQQQLQILRELGLIRSLESLDA